ncbi:sigma-70 family RNA polymerase sigma factor [Haloimpatiens massiliensis]|uniref:sigma-70 family RNA polymerase sigma factor n=1 Tax=Haloimpatiens massiliensis TaxID=1658110 RepID=UPI000C83AB1D|nr:RNA polymerase sigma factor RpoD/SigA [Haloimpatiens massiliensis]
MYCGIHDINKLHQETDSKNTFYENNKELIYLYKVKGDMKSKEKLILNNINLVRKVAFKKSKISSFTYEDLIQEGIIGLIKGIEKFDINKGTEFSTYVYYWINQHIDRAIYDKGFLVRLPVHVIEKINKINGIEKNQLCRYGCIKKELICKQLNISLEEYEEMKELQNRIKRIASLNQSANSEDGIDEGELLDIIPSYYSLNSYIYDDFDVEDTVYRNLLRKDIEKVLQTLSPREEKIIRDRFGLYEREPKTLEEIGKYYKITRERIRQIEAKTIRKLRHPTRARILKDYIIS